MWRRRRQAGCCGGLPRVVVRLRGGLLVPWLCVGRTDVGEGRGGVCAGGARDRGERVLGAHCGGGSTPDERSRSSSRHSPQLVAALLDRRPPDQPAHGTRCAQRVSGCRGLSRLRFVLGWAAGHRRTAQPCLAGWGAASRRTHLHTLCVLRPALRHRPVGRPRRRGRGRTSGCASGGGTMFSRF